MADFQNSYNYDYSDSMPPSRVNGLELIVIILMLIALIICGWMGFSTGTRENQDEQKSHDISQVIQALDYFYSNNQAYPIRQCSEDLNPVDFEMTLKKNLTGKVAKIGTNNYISSVEFPKDRTGEYTTEYSKYIYNIPCPSLIQENVNKNGKIYSDNTEACNYSRSTLKTKVNPEGKISYKCYLYTSSVSGDKYSVGYYSETLSKFVIISKFRLEKSTISYI